MTVEIKVLTPIEIRDIIIQQKVLSAEEILTLNQCVHWTTQVWAGYIDDKFVGAWGLAPTSILDDRAYLWLWTPPDMKHQLTFIRHSKRAVEDMLRIYPTIFGATDPKNYKAVKWLEWLGAKWTAHRTDGLLAFEIRREKVWQTLSA